MSRTRAGGASGAFRALMMIAAVLVVLIVPIVGLRLLPEDPEAVSATGDVTLTPGKRMLYVADGHVASLALVETGSAARGTPVVSELLCARVAAAAGTGLCLRRTSPVAWSATVLDRHLEATATYPLPGKPALATVSPSGRMVAWTSSAVTSVVDTRSGRQIEDLASFTVRQGDRRVSGHQVWGVTFVDDTRFYATVSVGGKRSLARGDLTRRTLRIVAPDGTNPAVSPEGRTLTFVRTRGEQRGRLALMDLGTRRVTDVDNPHTVSDQPVWLGPRTIAYVVRDDAGTPTIWAASLDVPRRPELLVAGGVSPSGL